jgi:hypothetical protein
MLKKVIDWFKENIAKAAARGHLNYTVTIHGAELQEMLDELRKVKKSIVDGKAGRQNPIAKMQNKQGGFSPPKGESCQLKKKKFILLRNSRIKLKGIEQQSIIG